MSILQGPKPTPSNQSKWVHRLYLLTSIANITPVHVLIYACY